MNAHLILAQAGDNGLAGFLLGLGAFGLVVAMILGLFWLWMLIDVLTNTSLDPITKLVWALVVFFLPFLGALGYLFVGRRPRTSAGA